MELYLFFLGALDVEGVAFKNSAIVFFQDFYLFWNVLHFGASTLAVDT